MIILISLPHLQINCLTELCYLHRIRLFNHGRMHEIHQEVAAQVGHVPSDQVFPPGMIPLIVVLLRRSMPINFITL